MIMRLMLIVLTVAFVSYTISTLTRIIILLQAIEACS